MRRAFIGAQGRLTDHWRYKIDFVLNPGANEAGTATTTTLRLCQDNCDFRDRAARACLAGEPTWTDGHRRAGGGPAPTMSPWTTPTSNTPAISSRS